MSKQMAQNGSGVRTSTMLRIGLLAGASAALLLVSAGGEARAAACPPNQPLCWLAPAPAPVVTVPPTTVPPATVPPVTVPPPPAAPRVAPEAAQRLLDLANAERARAGLGQLTSRSDVVAIATAHSSRMVAAGKIFHNDAYFTDATRVLLNSQARGENVAKNTSVDDTHTRLMNSPGHRANIMDPKFSVAGFGVVQAPDGQYYTTQNFMQPNGAPVKAAPQVTRPAPAPAAPRPAPAVPAATALSVVAPAPPAPTTTTTVAPPAVPDAGTQEDTALLSLARPPGRTLAASAGNNLPRQGNRAAVLPAVLLLIVVATSGVELSRRQRALAER